MANFAGIVMAHWSALIWATTAHSACSARTNTSGSAIRACSSVASRAGLGAASAIFAVRAVRTPGP